MPTHIPYRNVTITLTLLMLVGSIIGIVVPAGAGWDFACFYDAGRKAWAGQIGDLYETGVPIAGQPAQGQMAFWGLPLSSYFYAPLAPLAAPAALMVFKVQNTLALFAALLLLYWHTQRLVDDSPAARQRYAATFAFLALIYQPFWTIYRVGGQTTPTVLLLLVVGLLCHARAWFIASAACLTLAIMIKPAFASLLALLMLVSGMRFFAVSAIMLGLMLALSVALLGWELHATFLARMQQGAAASTVWVYNSALFVWLENLRLLADRSPTASGRPPLLSASLTALRLLVVLLFVRLYVVARAQVWSRAARLYCYFLLAIVLSLLIAPTVWEHYLSLLFIPLAYGVASHRYFSRAAHWAVALLFVLSLGQNLIFTNWLNAHLALDTVGALLLVGLLKSAPLLITLLLVWRHADELFASFTAPAWSR